MADVEGMQDLFARMDGLPYALQKVLIARALRAAAEPIREEAARRAPNDPSTPGGRIGENMKTFVRDQTATGARAEIAPKPWNSIARFAEFGTAHQSAEPFLRPAFDGMQDTAMRVLREELGAGIEAAWAKRAL